jgi:hypothetical protein
MMATTMDEKFKKRMYQDKSQGEKDKRGGGAGRTLHSPADTIRYDTILWPCIFFTE